MSGERLEGLTIGLALDTAGVDEGLKGLQRKLKVVNTEMDANLSAFDKGEKSLDKYGAVLTGLNKKMEVQSKIVSESKKNYDALVDAQKKSADSLKEAEKRVDAAKKAYEDLSKSQTATKKELNAAEKEIKASEKAYQSLSKEVKDSQKNIDNAANEVNKQVKAYNTLQGSIDKTKSAMDQMQREQKESSSGFDALNKKIDNSAEKLRGFGDKASGIGQSMSLGVTAPLAGFATMAVKTAGEYDAASSQFKVVFGDMEKEATSSLNNISKTTGLLPNALKGTYTQMAAFAKTTGADTKEAMDLTSRATMAAADSAAFYDKSIGEVSENLQSFLKGNYENDAALGISATETTRNAKANELYGKSFNDLNEQQKQLTLLKMVEDGNKLSGALGQASRESDTLGTQTANLKTAFADFQNEVGKPLLPLAIKGLKGLAGAAKTGATWFNSLSDDSKKMVLSLGGIAAAIGPSLMGLGMMAKGAGAVATGFKAATSPLKLFTKTGRESSKLLSGMGKVFDVFKSGLSKLPSVFGLARKAVGGLTTGFKLLRLAFATNPFGAVLLGLTALGAGLVYLYKHNEKFRNAVNKMGKEVAKIFGGLAKWAGKMAKDWVKGFNTGVEGAKNFGKGIGKAFSAAGKLASKLGKDWSAGFKVGVEATKNLAKNVGTKFNDMKKGAVDKSKALYKGVTGFFADTRDGIKTRINKAYEHSKTGFKNMYENGNKRAKDLKDKALGFYGNLRDGVKSRIDKAYEHSKTGFKNMYENGKKKTEDLKNKALGFYGNIRDGVKSRIGKTYEYSKAGFKSIYENGKSKAEDLSDKVKGFFGDIRDNVKDLTEKARDLVADNFKSMYTKATDWVEKIGDFITDFKESLKEKATSLGKSAANGAIAGLNLMIDGINSIASKIMDKNLLTKIPTLSTGTGIVSNGVISRPTLAIVGDKGPGNGPNGFSHEIIQKKNGESYLTPATDTLVQLDPGDRVINGTDTYNASQSGLLNLPKFSKGTDDKGLLAKAGEWWNAGTKYLGKIAGDIWDYMENPGKLVEDVIGSISGGFGNIGGFTGNLASAAFSKLKSSLVGKVKSWFDEFADFGGDGLGGILDPSQINYHFGHTAAYTNETGRWWHEGVDFPFVYQKVGTPMSGTLERQSFMSGGYGNWVKVISGAVELIFAHLKDFSASPASGTKVKAGDTVGLTGNSGFSTGPHLHFGRRVNGKDVDPEPWLKELKAKGSLKGPSGGVGSSGVSGNAASWEGSIRQAAKAMKVSLTQSDVSAIVAQIHRESGGNQNIVQSSAVWDVNTASGNPAQGLLQYIPQTFRAYAVPGHTNIRRGYDQLLAFFNNSNWRQDNPGGRSGWGPSGRRRFGTGGRVAQTGLYTLAEANYPEYVISTDPSKKDDSMKLLEMAASEIQGNGGLSKNKRPNQLNDRSGDNNQSGGNGTRLLDIMLKMIQNQEEQINELRKQTQAIREDRITNLDIDGRVIAKATHKIHKELDTRSQQFKPRMA